MKSREVNLSDRVWKLASVIFVFSIAVAMTQTIWAVHLEKLLGSASKVGFVNAFLMFVAFLSYFAMIPIIERNDKAKLFSLSVFILASCYFLFYFAKNIYLFILIAIILTISGSLRITSFGILVRDNSPIKRVSRSEGLIYSFMNSAWIIGPLIASFILIKFSENTVFLISSFVAILTVLLFISFRFKDKDGKKRTDNDIRKNFLGFFKDKDRIISYCLGVGVTTWWTLIYLYIPLFIIKSGLPQQWVGYFLFATAIPLVLLEYHFSKLAGKKGFRKMFNIGYFFVAIISLICFFIPNIYIILSLLVIASFGMAIVEPNTEAYFFDILKGKEEYRYYGPYNTTVHIGLIIGSALGAIILLFLPFKFLFILYSALMFIFFTLSFKTKRIIEENR